MGKPWFILLIFFIHPGLSHATTVCATEFKDLELSPNLKKLQNILDQNKSVGFVNKTKGSYFFIKNTGNKFKIHFYTTGFLDLFGIYRESTIEFCDKNQQLVVHGLGRVQHIYVENNRIEFGDRSDRESFTKGTMPEKLAQINKVELSQSTDEESP